LDLEALSQITDVGGSPGTAESYFLGQRPAVGHGSPSATVASARGQRVEIAFVELKVLLVDAASLGLLRRVLLGHYTAFL
jgi:hypothetical protein